MIVASGLGKWLERMIWGYNLDVWFRHMFGRMIWAYDLSGWHSRMNNAYE